MTAPVTLFGRRDFTPMQRIILAVLYERADRKGRVEMSQAEIARAASTDGTTVRRTLAALEQAGALAIERQGQKGSPQVVRITADLNAPRAA